MLGGICAIAKKEDRTIEINQEEYEKSRKIFSERISKQLSGEKIIGMENTTQKRAI